MNDKALQICSYEQSKRLKEAGFEWSTYYYYHETVLVCDKLLNYNWCDRSNASAPSIALALKWFRDVKGFDYSIIKESRPFEYSYNLLNGRIGAFHIKGYDAVESKLLDELLTLIEQSK